MMKTVFLTSLFLLFHFFAWAQQSDFIVLKKKNKTVATYFAGNHIEFISTGGAYRNALITGIQNDSIFLKEFLVHRIPTTIGTYILDTAGSFSYQYHYLQIHSFGPPNTKGFNIAGSGAALVGGATLLILGSGIVYISDREKFSPNLLWGSAVLGGLGYLMSKSGNKPIVVGKRKYHLHYMDMDK